MISIILCTKNSNALTNLKKNIQETIGVQFELIVIEDAKGKIGICKAYNQGTLKSKYDIICFMHDDIYFNSLNWGKIICSILSDLSIGIIGVAGCCIKTKTPSGWAIYGAHHFRRYRLNQSSKLHNKPDYKCYNPYNERLSNVVTLDGLWMCMRKTVWQKNPFDEQTFKGFHFYDLDICLKVYQHHRICVTYDILIEHRSMGNYHSREWLDNSLKFYYKWKQQLPVSTTFINYNEIKKIEYTANLNFTRQLLAFNYNLDIILKFVAKSYILNVFSRKNFKLLINLFKSILVRMKLNMHNGI